MLLSLAFKEVRIVYSSIRFQRKHYSFKKESFCIFAINLKYKLTFEIHFVKTYGYRINLKV
jgi:hypothetical protein